ncbi:hypothetical protein R5R35_013860 [Gryllus longicercus]|uniref:Hydroxylysine kinase n=1 Tax=Gryllus longicercus TaxID=2509291 RepID=A0AAN9VJE3_9ORTH
MSGSGGAGDGDGLQPGEDIRPPLGLAEAARLASALYGLPRDLRVRQLNAYDDRNFHLQVPGEVKPSNFWEHGYVLKVLNSLDSKNPERIEAQNEIMTYLGSKGITCTLPVQNIYGNYYSLEKINTINKEGSESGHKKYIVRLLTFQPGEILHNVPCTSSLLYELGSYVAKINILLKDFQHPGLHNQNGIWMLESVPKVKKFTFAVQDIQKHSLASDVIEVFEKDIVPIIPNLERGLLHGDCNEQNILVQKSPTSDDWCVYGIIDWGDCHISCYVFELAIMICYMMLQCKLLDPLEAPGHILAGYITRRKLPEIEFQLLKKCVCARLCQSLVLGAYSFAQDPSNKYVLTTAANGWNLLDKVWNMPEEILYKKWKEIIQTYSK